MPLIDAHRLKKERGSDSIEGLRKNSAGVFFANYFATYSMRIAEVMIDGVALEFSLIMSVSCINML